MNRTEHLLTCLAEECAEVAQRVSKALRFGLYEVQPGQEISNSERIVGELIDLGSVVNILVREGIISDPWIGLEAAAPIKLAKIERFMAISVEQGALTPDDGLDRLANDEPYDRMNI